jgi:hypothetical protein
MLLLHLRKDLTLAYRCRSRFASTPFSPFKTTCYASTSNSSLGLEAFYVVLHAVHLTPHLMFSHEDSNERAYFHHHAYDASPKPTRCILSDTHATHAFRMPM